ncbi:MAG TPA: hypothetical protein VG206_23135 [Terriglobia bacterium]|nr:hypothetical protein [Terriglobia bacterium]
MTVYAGNAALKDRCIRGFEALLGALDQLLAGVERYFDPEILPDPNHPKGFCARYQALCGAAGDLSEAVRASLPTRKFRVTRGAGLPIQGCLLRQDMEWMRVDAKACLAVLRSR